MSDLPNYTLHILAETLIAIHLNFIAGLRTKHNSRAKITRNKSQLSLSVAILNKKYLPGLHHGAVVLLVLFHWKNCIPENFGKMAPYNSSHDYTQPPL